MLKLVFSMGPGDIRFGDITPVMVRPLRKPTLPALLCSWRILTPYISYCLVSGPRTETEMAYVVLQADLLVICVMLGPFTWIHLIPYNQLAQFQMHIYPSSKPLSAPSLWHLRGLAVWHHKDLPQSQVLTPQFPRNGMLLTCQCGRYSTSLYGRIRINKYVLPSFLSQRLPPLSHSANSIPNQEIHFCFSKLSIFTEGLQVPTYNLNLKNGKTMWKTGLCH